MIIPPVTVEAGPVRHSRPSISNTQSPGGQWLSMTMSAKSINFFPEECAAATRSECCRETMAITGMRLATVKRVVYLSVHHADKAAWLPHFGSKIGVEEALKVSGIPFTILRPNNFYQNDYWFKDVLLQYGVYPQPLGSTGVSRVDVRDIADGVALSKQTNQKISGWNHGKMRALITYKAAAEGITVTLQDEHYTSQTCPQCGHRHKPRGRVYTCGQCGFSGHRDVVGQINILSSYLHGAPGKIPAPAVVKHRMPHNLRLMRRCQDTGQSQDCSLENSHV